MASLRRARLPRAGADASRGPCRASVDGQDTARRGALTPPSFPRESPMHDWTYESLIRKLKAALAEVETSADRLPSHRSLDAEGQEASSAVVRADTLPPIKQTRKG